MYLQIKDNNTACIYSEEEQILQNTRSDNG